MVHIDLHVDVPWASISLSGHLCVCQMSTYLLCTSCCLGPCPRGVDSLRGFPISAIGNLYSICFFFVVCFSLYFHLLQPVLIYLQQLCALGHHPSLQLVMASTFLGLTACGQHDMILQPQLIPGDTVRVSVGLATVPQQQ